MWVVNRMMRIEDHPDAKQKESGVPKGDKDTGSKRATG